MFCSELVLGKMVGGITSELANRHPKVDVVHGDQGYPSGHEDGLVVRPAPKTFPSVLHCHDTDVQVPQPVGFKNVSLDQHE